jgi:type II secretory pathway pseudopilin PulG
MNLWLDFPGWFPISGQKERKGGRLIMRQGHGVNERGVTLIELMVVAFLVAMIITVMPSSFRGGTQVWQKGDRHSEVVQNSLVAMEEMAREIKQADSIIAVSGSENTNGYIRLKYEDPIGEDGESVIGEDKYQEYEFATSDYLQHDYSYDPDGDPIAPEELAGPLTSLTFTCYAADDTTVLNEEGPLVNNEEEQDDADDIRSVLIQMYTHDSQGVVRDIPITDRVYIGSLLPTRRAGDDFVIYGDLGVDFRQNIQVYGSDSGLPGNVGSGPMGTIYLGNNVNIEDGVILGNEDNLDFQNEDQITYGGVFEADIELPCQTDLTGFNPDDYEDVIAGNSETVPPEGSTDPFLTPGPYRDLIMGNSCTLYLGSGNYCFRSITTGNNLNIYIDLSDGGDVKVFVLGQVDIGTQLDQDFTDVSVEGASAESVYWEIQYQSSSPDDPAFIIGRGADWIGTIYCPFGHLGDPNNQITDTTINGALYSGGWVYVFNNLVVNYVPSDYFMSLPYTCPPTGYQLDGGNCPCCSE